MRILHVPESEHPAFDLIDISYEIGFVALCHPQAPNHPLILIKPLFSATFTTFFTVSCALDSLTQKHKLSIDLTKPLELRWFLDQANTTHLGPLSPRADTGILIELDRGQRADQTTATPLNKQWRGDSWCTWDKIERWLLAREAHFLANAIKESLPSTPACEKAANPYRI